MIRHTQTICLQQTANCLSVFDHFVGLAHKGLTLIWMGFLGVCFEVVVGGGIKLPPHCLKPGNFKFGT